MLWHVYTLLLSTFIQLCNLRWSTLMATSQSWPCLFQLNVVKTNKLYITAGLKSYWCRYLDHYVIIIGLAYYIDISHNKRNDHTVCGTWLAYYVPEHEEAHLKDTTLPN